jgi:hypothetical protein
MQRLQLLLMLLHRKLLLYYSLHRWPAPSANTAKCHHQQQQQLGWQMAAAWSPLEDFLLPSVSGARPHWEWEWGL